MTYSKLTQTKDRAKRIRAVKAARLAKANRAKINKRAMQLLNLSTLLAVYAALTLANILVLVLLLMAA